MNKKRLVKIAEWLEAGAPEKKGRLTKVSGFNMSEYFDGDYKLDGAPECGSRCCIAGAAVAFFGSKDDCGHMTHHDHARFLLDLDCDEAYFLFTPPGRTSSRTSPKMAAKVIRNLIETGRVKWPEKRQPPNTMVMRRSR